MYTRRAVLGLGGRSARAPPSAAAGWPRPPQPVENGSKTAKPGERAHRHRLGVGEMEAHRVAARRVGQYGGPPRNGMGVQREGRGVRACGMPRVHGTCSPPRRAEHGMAWQRSRLDGLLVCTRRRAPDEGCEGARRACGRASRATPTSNRRVNASLRGRALLWSRCEIVSHSHQRRRAAWDCTSAAMAFESACGGKTSRRIGRLLGGPVAGWGLGL